MNLQALAAMDDCEHATGMTLEGHFKRAMFPKEVVAAFFLDRGFAREENDLKELAGDCLKELKDAGYDIIQRVSQGNKPFP